MKSYWIHVHTRGRCCGCGRWIQRGEAAYYFPDSKGLYCDAYKCAGVEERKAEIAAEESTWSEEILERRSAT